MEEAGTASAELSLGRLLGGGVFGSGWNVWARVPGRGNKDMLQGHVARNSPFGGRNERRSLWLRSTGWGWGRWRGRAGCLCILGFLRGFVFSSQCSGGQSSGLEAHTARSN